MANGCPTPTQFKVNGVWVKQPCGKTPDEGSRFCHEHQTQPKALKEKEQRALELVVTNVETVSDAVTEVEPQKTTEVSTKETYKPTSIFDKVASVLDNALQFEEDARSAYQERLQLAKAGDPEGMRYVDKAGAEQLRSEVTVYERAMDRTIRAVTAIAKLNIDNQAMQMNKMLKEIVRSTIIRVLQRLELPPDQIDLARRYIAEEFAKQSRASEK